MADERRVAFHGGGAKPARAVARAIELEELPNGRRVARVVLPGPLAELQRDLPALRKLNYTFRRIDLTAAGRRQIDFEANYFMVIRFAGTVSSTAELHVRFNDEDSEWISLQAAVLLTIPFTKVYLEWDAIVNGQVDILMGTALP